MPLYEYHCSTCDERFAQLRSVAERAMPAPCPICKSDETELVFSVVRAGESSCAQVSSGFS